MSPVCRGTPGASRLFPLLARRPPTPVAQLFANILICRRGSIRIGSFMPRVTVHVPAVTRGGYFILIFAAITW